MDNISSSEKVVFWLCDASFSLELRLASGLRIRQQFHKTEFLWETVFSRVRSDIFIRISENNSAEIFLWICRSEWISIKNLAVTDRDLWKWRNISIQKPSFVARGEYRKYWFLLNPINRINWERILNHHEKGMEDENRKI